jgi:hypothetical protein
MAEIRFCPFLRDECRKEECMLYEKSEISHLGEKGNCAVLNLSKEMKALRSVMDQNRKIV